MNAFTLKSSLLRIGAVLLGMAFLAATPIGLSQAAYGTSEVGAIAAKSKSKTVKATDRAMQKLKQTDQRWIEINLTNQRLIAWEGNTPVYAVIVSTGKAATPTLTGVFAVQHKFRTKRMQGSDYDVPNVPFTMFYDGNYAIHGAYWHNRFGTPVSHGCVNVAVNHAKWLYKWAGVGTPVVVRR